MAHRRRGELNVGRLEGDLVERSFAAHCKLRHTRPDVRLDELKPGVAVPAGAQHGGAEPKALAVHHPYLGPLDAQQVREPIERSLDVGGEDRDVV